MIDLTHTICTQLALVANQTRWQQRLAATALVIERATGTPPTVVPVRVAIYARAAALRLGGVPMPDHQGEIDQFCEQVGAGMVLLGFDQPHAVLTIGGVVIEVADAADWNGRGVLLHPFIHQTANNTETWIVDGLRHGVVAVYETNTKAEIRLSVDLDARRLARELETALRPPRQERMIGELPT